MKKIVTITDNYTVYVVPIGVEANASLTDTIGSENINDCICERMLDGKSINVIEIKSRDLQKWLEGKRLGNVNLSLFIGNRGEKQVFAVEAIAGPKMMDAFQSFITGIKHKLVALRLATKPPRHSARLRHTGSLP